MNLRALVVSAVVAAAASLAHSDPAPTGPLLPPSVPRHEQRSIDTASDLARDLAEVVAFLEQGQSYFKAFKKGSHSKEENAALLKFLEAYEKEREIAQREAALLHQWVKEKSELEPAEQKLEDRRKRP